MYVVDLDVTSLKAIDKERYGKGTPAYIRFGRGEFIGIKKEDGSDREQGTARDVYMRERHRQIPGSSYYPFLARHSQSLGRVHRSRRDALHPRAATDERHRNGAGAEQDLSGFDGSQHWTVGDRQPWQHHILRTRWVGQPDALSPTAKARPSSTMPLAGLLAAHQPAATVPPRSMTRAVAGPARSRRAGGNDAYAMDAVCRRRHCPRNKTAAPKTSGASAIKRSSPRIYRPNCSNIDLC